MRFDRRRGAEHRHRLDDVVVEGPLGEKFFLAEPTRFILENFDKLIADALAFDLGIFDPFQFVEEFFAGIDVAKARAEPFDKQSTNLFRLALAQQSIIHENTDEPFFDRAIDQRRRYRGIDAAAERAKHAPAAYLSANFLHRSVDEMLHRPVGSAAADAKYEIIQNVASSRCMRHLGMELHTEETPGRVGKSRDG